MDIVKKIFCTMIITGAIAYVFEMPETISFPKELVISPGNNSYQSPELVYPYKDAKINQYAKTIIFPVTLLKGRPLYNGWYLWALGFGFMSVLTFFTDIRKRFIKPLPKYLWIAGMVILPFAAIPAYFQFRPKGDLWECESCKKKRMINLEQCPYCSG